VVASRVDAEEDDSAGAAAGVSVGFVSEGVDRSSFEMSAAPPSLGISSS
jgi:hypothetical protein